MAPKLKTRNKKKPALPNKEANSTATWPDLPQKLVDIIAKQPVMMQHISYGGLTKLCRAPTSKCNHNYSPPCLQLLDGIRNNGNIEEKYVEPNLNASFYRYWFWFRYYSRWARPPVRSLWRHYVGYSHGAMVTKGRATFSHTEASDLLYLWFPVNGISYHELPEWDERIPIMRAVISSPATNSSDKSCTAMVLTGTSHPAFLFYRLKGQGRVWVKQDCTLTEPHWSTKSEGKNFMTFTNAIGFNGRFYALSLQGTLAVIDATESYPRITALSSERAVPSSMPKHYREYLLESEGDILLVFLISRKSIRLVDDVEVFQLNTEKLSLVKITSLGDRTLFLGTNCCISVAASKVGCRSNCVCFTYHTADGWWLFELETGRISPGFTADFHHQVPCLG